MTLWKPTRRELIGTAPLVMSAALPAKVWAEPASAPLRFFVIGDWGRRGNLDQRSVAGLINARAKEAAFILSAGDNFYNWGVKSLAADHWRQSFEDIYSPRLKQNWFSVLGNHDYSGDVEQQIAYRSPGLGGDRAGPPPWGWRIDARHWDLQLTAFQRPDIHLFFVDTVTWRGKEGFPHNLLGDEPSLGDQREQRRSLFAKLRQSPSRIKIVIGHHGIYSVGKHGGAMEMKDLDDVIRAGGASIYVNGHDHCLYHIQNLGMNYVCSGAGSQVLNKYRGGKDSGCVLDGLCPDPQNPEPFLPIWRSYVEDGGFALFDIARDSLTFRFVTVRGGELPATTIPIVS